MGRRKNKNGNLQNPELRKALQLQKFKELEQKKFELERERACNPREPQIAIKQEPKKVNKNKLKRDKKKPKRLRRLENTSRGELYIINYLIKKEIKFEREYIFKDLFNPQTSQPLRFDFYLPDYKLLIEFDGAQHFMYVKELHGEDEVIGKQKLKAQQYRDELKNEYCKRKDINLLRINYKDINNVEKILRERLKW